MYDRVIVSIRDEDPRILLRMVRDRENLELARGLKSLSPEEEPLSMKRRLDSRTITTAAAAVIACTIMGSAITKIMLKRVGNGPHRPPAMESQKTDPATNPTSPKPSKEAHSLTA